MLLIFTSHMLKALNAAFCLSVCLFVVLFGDNLSISQADGKFKSNENQNR
jgi:hypothetical protein